VERREFMADQKLMQVPTQVIAAKEECDYCIGCMACGITPTPDFEVAILAHLASWFAME
jgi:hypothetical protein